MQLNLTVEGQFRPPRALPLFFFKPCPCLPPHLLSPFSRPLNLSDDVFDTVFLVQAARAAAVSAAAAAATGGVSEVPRMGAEIPAPPPGVDVLAALCCLRGQAYANLDNRPRAAVWLRTALEIDARCVEALQCLTRCASSSLERWSFAFGRQAAAQRRTGESRYGRRGRGAIVEHGIPWEGDSMYGLAIPLCRVILSVFLCMSTAGPAMHSVWLWVSATFLSMNVSAPLVCVPTLFAVHQQSIVAGV